MLDEEAKEKGYALMCVAEPQSDCRIKVIDEVSPCNFSKVPLAQIVTCQLKAAAPVIFPRSLLLRLSHASSRRQAILATICASERVPVCFCMRRLCSLPRSFHRTEWWTQSNERQVKLEQYSRAWPCGFLTACWRAVQDEILEEVLCSSQNAG